MGRLEYIAVCALVICGVLALEQVVLKISHSLHASGVMIAQAGH